MSDESKLREQWHEVRDRLAAKKLLNARGATLSLRIPGTDTMWFGVVTQETPKRAMWRNGNSAGTSADLHAAVYGCRNDVTAVAIGGGKFGMCLSDFGGTMPRVFDEQVRHLGCMGLPVEDLARLQRSLGAGGNVVLVRGQPVCLGMTASRLALNAELFEKCAKAYVLAMAAGGPVRPLPWLVRTIANRRLMKDERSARRRVRQGLLPEESRGY